MRPVALLASSWPVCWVCGGAGEVARVSWVLGRAVLLCWRCWDPDGLKRRPWLAQGGKS